MLSINTCILLIEKLLYTKGRGYPLVLYIDAFSLNCLYVINERRNFKNIGKHEAIIL